MRDGDEKLRDDSEAERGPQNDADRNHHRYDATLIGLVRSGAIDPAKIPHPGQADAAAIAAYQAFDRREPSWLKVEPKPQGAQAEAAANRRAGCGRVSSRASIRLAP